MQFLSKQALLIIFDSHWRIKRKYKNYIDSQLFAHKVGQENINCLEPFFFLEKGNKRDFFQVERNGVIKTLTNIVALIRFSSFLRAYRVLPF